MSAEAAIERMVLLLRDSCQGKGLGPPPLDFLQPGAPAGFEGPCVPSVSMSTLPEHSVRPSLALAVGVILGQGAYPESPSVLAAMRNLTTVSDFSLSSLRALPGPVLEQCLQPCAKPLPLQRFLALLGELHGEFPDPDDLGPLHALGTEDLLETLIKIKGLGFETVDSLVLHVLCRPRFPAGAGIYRIALRHGFVAEETTREEVSEFFTAYLADDLSLMQGFHRGLQKIARLFCKSATPACLACPFKAMLDNASA